MLSSIHVSSPATITRPGIPRPPGPLLGARTLAELRELLATVLRGLFHDDIRFELYVADASGDLVSVAADAAAAPSWAQLAAAARSRGATWRRAAEPSLRLVDRSSAIRAPLVDATEEPIGLMVVEAPPGAPGFTRLHAETLEGIAGLVSLAVQRLRAADVDRERARVELDRRAARRVQRRLMSGSLPSGIGVTAYAEYLPALDVGGDFYCLKHLGDGTVGAVIGDVSGHGVSAALVMSRVESDFERVLAAGLAPSAVLHAVNASLSGLDADMFVTASCLRVDARARRLTVANAGHLPLAVRRADGRAFACGSASGTPLGMVPCEYDDDEIAVAPGDFVLLATDGLLEALDPPSGRLGLEMLLDLVREGPHDARVLHARIRAAVDEARRARDLDDVTWVGLQVA